MDEVQLFLANIWFVLIGLMLVFYVVLDGFDLGVGVLSLFACDEDRRGVMMASLGTVWDANETWLVLLGGALFGAFPLFYATVFHALYIPTSLMILGLVFRGVAFEFHENAVNKRPWGLAFGGGSLLAALSQGAMLGAVIAGLPMEGERFSGSVWHWLSPFAGLVAVGVVFGYALLGSTYLILKTRGEIQRRSYRRAGWSALITFAAGALVTLFTPLMHPGVADKWFNWPAMAWIAFLPLTALVAFALLLRSLRRRYETAPFVYSLLIFVCSFAGLAISLYPYLLPPELTIVAAASSSKTLVFMLAGIGMLLPVMIIYNGYQYLVFRGKVGAGHGESGSEAAGNAGGP